jgi:hypothetical protein
VALFPISPGPLLQANGRNYKPRDPACDRAAANPCGHAAEVATCAAWELQLARWAARPVSFASPIIVCRQGFLWRRRVPGQLGRIGRNTMKIVGFAPVVLKRFT